MAFRQANFVISALAVGFLPFALAMPAAAEPATPVAYPAGASATRYAGPAFDTCTAPAITKIRAWRASPYRAVGIYIGGTNRSCRQPALTASWVNQVSRLRWRLLPIYVGRQAPCAFHPNVVKITPWRATAQGQAEARDAVRRARALGLLPGSALYADIEHYSWTNSACRRAVLRYVSGWTRELHRLGYLSGVYAHLYAAAKHLSDTFTSTAFARPDAIWIARWDNSAGLTGWAGIPNARWSVHQRAKQYRGGHAERHGGVAIRIDSNRLDAPVATVAHAYRVTSRGSLNARSGPSGSYRVVRRYPRGATVRIVCQTTGSTVGSSKVWNRLVDGTYVSDYYVSTPSNTGFSSPLPRCSNPYQVTAAGALYKRGGPGTSYAVVGALPTGSLAWIGCQRAGTRVAISPVWNRLDDGRWVADYYVATPSNTTYSKPIPRC